MCGCILGWQSVVYHFGVTVTLPTDLVFIIIVSRAYLLYCLRYEYQMLSVGASWNGGVSRTIFNLL